MGPEEPLIPLRVGGESRPNLGLACEDKRCAKRLDSSNFFASGVSMNKCSLVFNIGTGTLNSWALSLAERVRQDNS